MWKCIGLKLNRVVPLTSVLAILVCVPAHCSSQLRDVIVAAIVHTMYCIWLARNAFRFSSASPCIHSTLARITSMVALSGMLSNSNCINLDVVVFNKFLIPPSFRRVKDIALVVWKPPTISWVKANTDGSGIYHNASCGGIFRDFRGTFLGCFASNVGRGSVFDAEILGLIFAMEFVAKHNWNRLWLECDSTSVVHAFKNPDVVPIRLRNRWHNCFQHGMMVLCSHIFQEGNCFVVPISLLLWVMC